MNNNLKKDKIERIHKKVIDKIIVSSKQNGIIIDKITCTVNENSVVIHAYFPTYTKEREYNQNGIEDKIKKEYLAILTEMGYFKKTTEEIDFYFGYTKNDLKERQWYYVKIARGKMQEWAEINECPIYKVEFVPIDGEILYVNIFYLKDSELKQYTENGAVEKTKQEFLKILKEMGYMDEFNDNIVFEFDSDENVKRNYDGNYYYRLLG